ncbi:MAG: metallophosphoesterase [Bacteroidota bacterium]|nr:metallophosphoesterase [Bacteroidota bacterium]
MANVKDNKLQKVIAIGDLHGKNVWRNVPISKYDKVVFMGDYVDSKDKHTIDEISQNLIDIISLKKRFPDKIVLLLGNHDNQYLHYPKYRCSGFLPEAKNIWSSIFRNNEHLFNVALQYKNYLFTHAGISQTWYKKHASFWHEGNVLGTIIEEINKDKRHHHILYEVSEKRGGKNEFGGIFWADRTETCENYLPNIHQIVGHTRISDIIKYGDNNASITYVDCLSTVEKYWEAEI